MDFSRFKTSDWMIIGGGVGFLIFGLLKWFSFSIYSENAFDFFFTGILPWILIVASGVIAFLLATGNLKREQAPWTLILLGATALGTLLVLLRVIIGREIEDVRLDRGYGLWLSLISAIAATVGAVMKFTDSGGNLRDLTDTDKLRSAFDRPDAGTPPPPPPPSAGGASPPPPPPPPV